MINWNYPARILSPEEKRLQRQSQRKMAIYQDFVTTHKNLTERQEMRVYSLRFNPIVSVDKFIDELKKI